jgi:hypothetical protein
MGSDYLFDTPSFLSGIARSLDLWGVFVDYNSSQTPEMADLIALYADWRATGEDLLAATQLSTLPDPQQLPLFVSAA